jgi:hypothetical protein
MESRMCRWNGLVQIAFWSPGKFKKALLIVTVLSAEASAAVLSLLGFCPPGEAGSSAIVVGEAQGLSVQASLEENKGGPDPSTLCWRQAPLEDMAPAIPAMSDNVRKTEGIRMMAQKNESTILAEYLA